MSLRTEPTSQSLEKKLLILGFEVPDVLAIFLLLSFLNFFVGKLGNKFFLVWLPVALAALILRIGKRGKPDNYLLHLARFNFKPKYYSAFQEPSQKVFPPSVHK
jgi:hypothetical protein